MSKPIRVLHVFASLNRGGAESRTMDIYRAINKNKIQFDFVVHNGNGEFEEEVLNLGGRIYRFNPPTYRNLISYKKQWSNFFSTHREYDIIHGHITSFASIYIKTAKKFNINTRIVHIRSANINKIFKKFFVKVLNNNIHKHATHMFAVSKKAGYFYFGKNLVKNGKVKVLKNAIDAKKYIFNSNSRNDIREKLKVTDKHVIGHVGRFHYAKNHKFIIEVFFEICKINPNAVLLLVGDGEERKKITELVSILKLDNNVIFTGEKLNVSEYLQAMDVFLFPSFYEGLPGSVVEAQAAGLPCFISNTITEEVCITNCVHVLSLKDSAVKWANKIQELEKENSKRDNMYKKIVNSGFDIDKLSKELEIFYLNNNKIVHGS